MGVLPPDVEEVLNAALVCEFTVVTAAGRPVSHPMIPLYDGEKLYLHSSILFSKKLSHVRDNPKVSISVSDLAATHGEPLQHRVTVQGDAELYEGDVHEEWQRILPLWIAKEEGIFAGTSSALNVVAALQLAKELGPGKVVATVAIDTGLKYLAGDLFSV